MQETNEMRDRLIKEFAENYMEKLFYFCLKKTGSHIEAEDLTQDIALQIITALNKSTIPTSFSAWVKALSGYCTKGKPVTVHCSLKAIGEIEGGAETLLSALKECFASGVGLLVIPTHTWDERILDLRNPRTCIGVLPTVAARDKEAVRSRHPSHSVAVFGDRAQALDFVRGDESSDTLTSPNGSYGRLYDCDGYIFLIGVGQEKNTFIHCVEEMLGVPRYLPERVTAKGIDESGAETDRELYWFDEREIADVSEYFGKFEAALDYHGCIEYGTLGRAKTQMVRARDIKRIIELIYKNADGRELLSDHIPLDPSLYR